MTRNRPGSPATLVSIVEQFSNYSNELEVLCGCVFVVLKSAFFCLESSALESAFLVNLLAIEPASD